MLKIKSNEIWSTYVIVTKSNHNTWYNMNINRKEMEKQLTDDTCLAKWTYRRSETGDELIKQEIL